MNQYFNHEDVYLMSNLKWLETTMALAWSAAKGSED